MDVSQLSIWSAALMAAAGQVKWQAAADHLSFAAPANVTVDALGIELRAGDVLEVRWLPGDTAYSATVRAAGGSQSLNKE